MNNFPFITSDVYIPNTYKIKTKTKYMAKPKTIGDLQNLINYLNKNNIKYYLLGRGSNIILPDKSFNGCIISLEKLNTITINKNMVTAMAGVTLNKLITTVIAHNLKGLEYLFGIPGSLGGALYGNAGAYNHTIYDYLLSVDVLRGGKIITLKKEELDFAYRYTSFKENNDIIIRANFGLEPGNREEENNIIRKISKSRLDKLPLDYPNAGSVFKNPLPDYAGRLIEEVNLKGYKIGGAKVSAKHANFIINTGNMTSNDVKSLVKVIKTKVKEQFNIELELEQIIIEWD